MIYTMQLFSLAKAPISTSKFFFSFCFSRRLSNQFVFLVVKDSKILEAFFSGTILHFLTSTILLGDGNIVTNL